MSDNLPDEIISEILSPTLKVPESMFSDTSLESPFGTISSSSSPSSTLLVCKSWLRVATPLLYSFVIIRSKAQANALQAALQNPDLGRMVKNLRVEGGFGKPMHQILQSTPNIRHIVLSLHLRASDSADGLAKGLSLINPSCLTIVDDTGMYLKNKSVVKLMDAIKASLPKWDNLTEVNFPYTMSLDHRIFYPHCIKIADYPALEIIEIRSKRGRHLDDSDSDTDREEIVDSRVRWRDNLTTLTHDSPSLWTSFTPTDPSFTPLASTSQLIAERIWSRILFFAMLSLEQHPTDTKPGKLDKDINSSRLQFLLVSHLFQRLARPYLYWYPVILNLPILTAFSAALVGNPSLGSYVRELDLRLDTTFFDSRSDPSATDSLAAILPSVHNLTRLIATTAVYSFLTRDPTTNMSWNDLKKLTKTAGHTLQEFTGVVLTLFSKKNHGATYSPAVFNRFPVLSKLSWQSAWGMIDFDPVDEVSVEALPALQSLAVFSTTGYSLFAQMKLPSLTQITLENEKDAEATLLRVHGSKIRDLEIRHTLIGEETVFTLCPHLTTLTWKPKAHDKYNLGCSALDAGFEHKSLNKIILIKEIIYGKKDDEDWEKLFAAVVVGLPYLPALREVAVPWCRWPRTEHEMRKNVWVKWAETFLKHDIKMTGHDGIEWRPRLKTSRAR
ncbi:hypothetical protein DFH06DRAFT_1430487 [Mycena polygramma]|nr:hypothetical protein DFH06DRAFT_1430487 [Mycena polygramma]